MTHTGPTLRTQAATLQGGQWPHTRSARSLAPLVGLALFGCGSGEQVRTSVTAGPGSTVMELKANIAYRTVIDSPDALGISGSCSNNGETWLVTERDSHLLRLTPEGTVVSIAIQGAPDDLDMEGLACKDGRFYVSTESEIPDRTTDVILVVEVQGSTASVVDTITMQYPEDLVAGVNQGLEGLCIAGDWLIAAGEVIRTDTAGVRQAPILRRRLGESNTFLHWVNLSTSTGKLSGIDCRMRGNTFEVFAIERHYEVSRILRFDLGTGPSQFDTVLDLAHLVRDTENFESILVSDRGEIRLTNDNQYKTITGPSEETVLEIVPSFAR